jgi:hypothetical protein
MCIDDCTSVTPTTALRLRGPIAALPARLHSAAMREPAPCARTARSVSECLRSSIEEARTRQAFSLLWGGYEAAKKP